MGVLCPSCKCASHITNDIAEDTSSLGTYTNKMSRFCCSHCGLYFSCLNPNAEVFFDGIKKKEACNRLRNVISFTRVEHRPTSIAAPHAIDGCVHQISSHVSGTSAGGSRGCWSHSGTMTFASSRANTDTEKCNRRQRRAEQQQTLKGKKSELRAYERADIQLTPAGQDFCLRELWHGSVDKLTERIIERRTGDFMKKFNIKEEYTVQAKLYIEFYWKVLCEAYKTEGAEYPFNKVMILSKKIDEILASEDLRSWFEREQPFAADTYKFAVQRKTDDDARFLAKRAIDCAVSDYVSQLGTPKQSDSASMGVSSGMGIDKNLLGVQEFEEKAVENRRKERAAMERATRLLQPPKPLSLPGPSHIGRKRSRRRRLFCGSCDSGQFNEMLAERRAVAAVEQIDAPTKRAQRAWGPPLRGALGSAGAPCAMPTHKATPSPDARQVAGLDDPSTMSS